MKKQKTILIFSALALLFVLTGCSTRNQNQEQSQTKETKQIRQENQKNSDENPGPPDDANFENMKNICSEKNEGDACTIEKDSDLVEGTCQKDRDGKSLMCRPNDMPEGMQQGGPPSPDMMPPEPE